MDHKLLEFQVNTHDVGKSVDFENGKQIPFDIKRVYYIYDTASETHRGKHAHPDLEQVVVCLKGSCKFSLESGGGDRHIVELNRPDKGLYIGKMVWREMFDFSYGCILLVMASDYYDEKEYIRNYEDFLELIKNPK